MRTLIHMLEGLLDADFDVTDNDVMPGVKNWPRFLGRLQTIPKPKLCSGEKYRKWVWPGNGILDTLSQGLKLDIGPTVGKNKAIDISIDREQIVLAAFWPCGDRQAGEICIGNNNGGIRIRSTRFDDVVNTTVEEMGNIGLRLASIEAKNWKLRIAPLATYDIIRRELGLL